MITTTLKQSKRLKELGAPQDTVFAYRDGVLLLNNYDIAYVEHKEIIPCYTLSELIEWLPKEIDGYILALVPVNNLQEWEAIYLAKKGEPLHGDGFAVGKTPLEAVYNLAIAVKGQ